VRGYGGIIVPRHWLVVGGLAGASLAAVGVHTALTASKIGDVTDDLRAAGGNQALIDQLAVTYRWLFLDAGLLLAATVALLLLVMVLLARSGHRAETRAPERATDAPLSSLPDRRAFEAALRAGLARTASERGRGLTILMISLAGVADVVRAHGTGSLEQLLIAASRRLRRVIRDDDEVARVGDQDFGVLLHEITDLGGIEAVTDRIEESFSRPFRLQTGIAPVRANIGAVVCGPDSDLEAALARVEAAMYRADAAGGGVVLVDGAAPPPTPAMPSGRAVGAGSGENVPRPPARETNISDDLKALLRDPTPERAVDRESDLVLAYEPVVRLSEGAVTGAAATARWRHPAHGLMPDDELYPLAETSGLVTPLMGRLIARAASHAAAWNASGSPLTVSLRLSAGCLSDPWFVPAIQAAVERVSLDPRLLVLEFAQSGVLAEPQLTTPALTAIRRIGLGVAVTEFGFAPVSLAQLGRLPVDEFKINCAALSDPAAAGVELVTEAVGTAHALGAAAVGYAVGTTAALSLAEEAGFDRLHGPVFGPPAWAENVLLACEQAFELAFPGRKAGPRHGMPEGWR
jgi:diguanylate cyclase (GGDEF)-like protein